MKARENPFRSDRLVALRYRLAEPEWSALLDRLASLGNRAALVGPNGSGKSTLLRELDVRLRARGIETTSIYLDDLSPAIPLRSWMRLVARPRAFVLLDGAERVAPLAWLALRIATARAKGLVVTTHIAGRLATLRDCTTSPELLADLVDELAGVSAVARDEVEALHAAHRGNIREALRALYDRQAALPSPNSSVHEQNGSGLIDRPARVEPRTRAR